jgi:hypothetical protein
VPLATSTLGLLLAETSQLPHIFELGFAAGVTTVGLRTMQEWHRKKHEIEGNQLYFYYRAGKSIKSSI